MNETRPDFVEFFRKNCVTGGRRSSAWLVLVAEPRTRLDGADWRSDGRILLTSVTHWQVHSFVSGRKKKFSNFFVKWNVVYFCGGWEKIWKNFRGPKHFCRKMRQLRQQPTRASHVCRLLFSWNFSSGCNPPVASVIFNNRNDNIALSFRVSTGFFSVWLGGRVVFRPFIRILGFGRNWEKSGKMCILFHNVVCHFKWILLIFWEINLWFFHLK